MAIPQVNSLYEHRMTHEAIWLILELILKRHLNGITLTLPSWISLETLMGVGFAMCCELHALIRVMPCWHKEEHMPVNSNTAVHLGVKCHIFMLQ